MKSIPFLRIIIPFLTGLYFAFWFEPKINQTISFLFLFTLLLCFVYLQLTNKHKVLTLLIFDLLMINFAFMLVEQSKSSNNQNSIVNHVSSNQELTYLASLSEIPIEKQNFIKCQLKLSCLIKEKKAIVVEGNIIAYFKKPIANDYLKPGNILLIRSKFLTVPTVKNPMEFNYATYLANKQIFFTSFINQDAFCVYDAHQSNLNFLFEEGLKIKYKIVNQLRSSRLSKDAFAICSALITGYDDEIDKSIVDAFAHSGTLHVLSVSGLHVGLIYLVLNFLFNLFDRHNRYKRSRFFLISILLWCFALITGFSPPVLRAVLMFNLLGFGKIFYRSNASNQLNVLLFTALVLLIYNPYFIFDIGFLLSYSAMVGIVVFTPLFLNRINTKNKILLYVYESVVVSVAATITTLPLTLFYFKQFPIWFFVSNLIVVPLSFLILILAFVSLFHLPVMMQLVNLLVDWMIGFIQIFNQGKFTYIDFIHFRLRDVLFLFSLILLLYFLFKERRFTYALFALIILLTWQVSCLFDAYSAKQSTFLSIYQVKNKSRMLVKNKTEANYNQFDSLSFNYNLKPHFTSFNYPKMKVVPFNYIKSKNGCCLILNHVGMIPQTNLEEVKTVLVANNFVLNEKHLQQFEHIELILADASNQTNIIYKTENLCRKFGIPFHNTRLKGAYTMALE